MRAQDLQKVADLMYTEGFEAHRGAFHLKDGDFLVFGNDGYTQDKQGRGQREAETVRQTVQGRAEALGFAVDSTEGYSWCMVLRFTEGFETRAGRELCRDLLTAALWQGWLGLDRDPVGQAFAGCQGGIAEEVIERLRPKILELLEPEAPLCLGVRK
jgi:hypothetical protein